MGREMYALSVAPTTDDWTGVVPGSIIASHFSPYALLNAATVIPDEVRRSKFHYLAMVRNRSGCYTDENLFLSPAEVERVRDDFERFLRVSERKEFIHGLTADHIHAYWADRWESVDTIREFLNLAVETRAWLRIAL